MHQHAGCIVVYSYDRSSLQASMLEAFWGLLPLQKRDFLRITIAFVPDVISRVVNAVGVLMSLLESAYLSCWC